MANEKRVHGKLYPTPHILWVEQKNGKCLLFQLWRDSHSDYEVWRPVKRVQTLP